VQDPVELRYLDYPPSQRVARGCVLRTVDGLGHGTGKVRYSSGKRRPTGGVSVRFLVSGAASHPNAEYEVPDFGVTPGV
jgi:hypothetical protein